MLSYSRGPDQPLWEKTIGQVLDRDRRTLGRLSGPGFPSSIETLYLARTARTGRSFCPWAVVAWNQAGDRVGLWSTNCVEWVVVHLGCARAGAILVNVNPAYRTHELAYTLRKSRMKALFLWESDARAEYAQILAEARKGQNLQL